MIHRAPRFAGFRPHNNQIFGQINDHTQDLAKDNNILVFNAVLWHTFGHCKYVSSKL